MPSDDLRAEVELLVAKQALHELNTAYCRAVDRLDGTALVDLFCSTGMIDSGVLRGPPVYFAHEFAIWVRRNARVIFHAITNEWFAIDGPRAIGESYVLALSRLRTKTGESDVLTAGRYLDRFEYSDTRWRFSARRFVLDHSTTLSAGESAQPEPGQIGDGRGCFAPHDPVYQFWEQLHPRR
jgi:hypothetical protein